MAPRAMYGSDCRSMLPPERLHPSGWRRCARVGSGLALGFAAVLLCLSGSEQPGASGSSELDSVVSLPVMGTGGGPSLPYHDGNGFVVSLPVFGTGGGPTTRPIDDGSDSSKPVMGTACKDCPELDGPTVQRPGGWQNYSSEFNVFGLKAYTGGIYNAQPSFTGGDADTPGALPNAGRNEWNNNFADYDFKPADKHDRYCLCLAYHYICMHAFLRPVSFLFHCPCDIPCVFRRCTKRSAFLTPPHLFLVSVPVNRQKLL